MLFERLVQVLPQKYVKRLTFDANEKTFLGYFGQTKYPADGIDNPRLIVQMPTDYFYLVLFFIAIKKISPKKVDALWHQNIMSAPRYERWSCLKKFLRQFARLCDRLKWEKLYSAIGATKFNTLEVDRVTAFKNALIARVLFNKIKSKADVLNISLNGTLCGDLIYDTYLRYRVQPTVDIKDPYLRTVITQALNAQTAMRRLLARNKFGIFLTSYTSYVQHGIPAREALNAGVEVFSSGNLSQYFKRLQLSDTLHTTAHWLYKEQFGRLLNQESALDLARNELELRFQGGVDRATLYMKESAYTESNLSMPEGIEGVVFLHDFFDSPHCHRNMLFCDFMEWADFTLRIIQQHALPIAIKPHPNQLDESKEVVAKLKLQYPEVRWLPVSISNRNIFEAGIKCGISVYGTILHELAYHGIPALAAGDHPHCAFDIAITPSSVSEYEEKLIGFRKIELPKDAMREVLAFYYMHNLHKNEGITLDVDALSLRTIKPSDSRGLCDFLNRLEAKKQFVS